MNFTYIAYIYFRRFLNRVSVVLFRCSVEVFAEFTNAISI